MLKILRSGVILLGVSCAGFLQPVCAQLTTETHWYFGNSQATLVFDKDNAENHLEEIQAIPFGRAGSAVIVDEQKGNVLFYSDGVAIFDNSNQIVPGWGSDRLNGDLTRIQPVVACPIPNGNGDFFFFTHTGSSIESTRVNSREIGNSTVAEFPLGDVLPFALNQPTGFTNPGELLDVILTVDSLGARKFWLLTQDATSLLLQVTEINGTGLAATNEYDVFPNNIGDQEISTVSSIRVDSTGQYSLALGANGPFNNVVLLDFNPTSGEPAFQRSLINTGFGDAGSHVHFDIEWSNDGTKLYVSRTGDDTNPGNVYQIDFSDTVNINPPPTRITNYSFFRSYGLKKALDGRIYHLYQLNSNNSSYQLGRILRPDSSVAVNVLYDSLVYDNNFNGTQFPHFSPPHMRTNYFNAMSFTYFDSCLNNATKFVAQVDPLPNNYFWSFGDGGFGSGPAPIHTYAQSGTYQVELVVELNDYFQSSGLVGLPILMGDSAVDLGNDTTICVDETLMLDADIGTPGAFYLWSTGFSGIDSSSIAVDTAGTYWVEVTGPTGCSTFDDIVVTEYGVQQTLFNQWYFGEQAGLDFNFNPPVALADSNRMFSAEGCATMSDSNGDLLFYTNGDTVWNKVHEVMENGIGLGGEDGATQSALILPFNDDQTLFYILTTEEVYGTDFAFNLKMSIVDLKADRARGRVAIKNIPIIECSSERITASSFAGTPWLVAREFGNNNFRSYQINGRGVVGPVHSTAGERTRLQNALQASGYMKFSPSGNQIALIIPGSTNYVDILDYNIVTGRASNSRLIDIQETEPAYGLEFSGDGLKLYVTTRGANSKLIQYDLDSLNSPNAAAAIEATKFDGYTTTMPNYGALQSGPNGVIYLAIDGASQVGTIDTPGADDLGANFQESPGIDLLGRTSRLGLPNFTQQVGASPQQPSIGTQTACVLDTTLFTGTGRDPSIEEYQWDFGDGNTTGILSSPDTNYVYSNPGTYVVSLTLTNRCDTALTLTDTLEVYAIPENPTVPTDTALCGGPLTLSAWPRDSVGLNYLWSTGDTTRSVTFISPTIASVIITNDQGCSSETALIFIGRDETFIDLGPDLTICQNDTLILDSEDPGPDYLWTEDGVEIGTEQTQMIIGSRAGSFYYGVRVINDITGCIYRDSVLVEVQPAPEAIQSTTQNPGCGQANGSIALDFVDGGRFRYQFSGPVVSDEFTFQGPGTTDPVAGLSSGTYALNTTNVVTGCTSTQIIQLEDDAPFEMDAVAEGECVRTGDIAINFSNNIPAIVEINVLNRQGINVFSASQELRNRTFRVNDLDSGTYFVQVLDLNPPNCLQTDTVTLSVTEACYRQIFVPNAFSPNGNGQNDEWFAFPSDFVNDFEVFVYNRWGDLIFYSQNKNFRWNGSYAGQFVPSGTYAYRMVFTSSLEPELGSIEQYGAVTVVK